MDYQEILVEKQDRVTIITINRPQVLNAVSGPLSREMDHALNRFQDDPQAWVCILTGAGDKAFSAGMDLKWFNENGAENYRRIMGKLQGLGGITKRHACYKPLIAAVNGLAFGGGFEMALACDIIIAAEHATFSLPEPRVGLMAAEGGVQRLPRRIPYHAAMSLILTGRRMSAAEARDLGLVSEVAPLAELPAAARKWADMILECSPMAIRAAKETVLRSINLPLEEAMDKVYPGREAMFASEDFAEGQAAFAQRRKPQWKGR